MACSSPWHSPRSCSSTANCREPLPPRDRLRGARDRASRPVSRVHPDARRRGRVLRRGVGMGRSRSSPGAGRVARAVRQPGWTSIGPRRARLREVRTTPSRFSITWRSRCRSSRRRRSHSPVTPAVVRGRTRQPRLPWSSCWGWRSTPGSFAVRSRRAWRIPPCPSPFSSRGCWSRSRGCSCATSAAPCGSPTRWAVRVAVAWPGRRSCSCVPVVVSGDLYAAGQRRR